MSFYVRYLENQSFGTKYRDSASFSVFIAEINQSNATLILYVA